MGGSHEKSAGALFTYRLDRLHLCFGFLVFLTISPWVDFHLQRYSLVTWGSVAALAVTSSILGHLLWNSGLQRVEAGQAGVFLALEPLAGVGLAALILQEPLSAFLLIGLLLVVVAMLLATWPSAPAQVTQRHTPQNPSRLSKSAIRPER